MRDKQILTGYVFTGVMVLVLFLSTLFLEADARNAFIKEGGPVELITVFCYFLCAVSILYEGKINYLRRYGYFFGLVIFFMLREMDFDKKFTTMGILKSKFYISTSVPLIEKIIGGMVVILFFYILFMICFRHYKIFFIGLKKYSVVSIGALLVIVSLFVSKSLDGLQTKLARMGIDVSNTVSLNATSAEEIIELSIPIFLFFTFHAFFKQNKEIPLDHSKFCGLK